MHELVFIIIATIYLYIIINISKKFYNEKHYGLSEVFLYGGIATAIIFLIYTLS